MDDCGLRKSNCALLTALIVILLSQCATGMQLPEVPYFAVVSGDDAIVQSGPGGTDAFYSTSQLSAGDTVQVFRHDPGGWCAIRPPQDSFSLLPEDAVRFDENNNAFVKEDSIRAWVGTATGPVEKPLWQVKLKVDEPLMILGQISWPDPEGHSTIWYQIAPPNGEFRWIHIDQLQLPPETKIAKDSSQPVRRNDLDLDEQNPEQMVVQNDSEIFEPNYEMDNEGWRPAKIPFAKQENRFDQVEPIGATVSNQIANNIRRTNFQESVRGTATRGTIQNRESTVEPERLPGDQLSQQRPPERIASNLPMAATLPILSSIEQVQPISSIGLSQRLQTIEFNLNNEVVKPMGSWDLQNLGMDVQEIISKPQDTAELAAAQRLLTKIENFRRIQQNTNRIESAQRPNGQVQQDEATGIYDAQGWLAELYQQRGTVDSAYVLQDSEGRITHYVQATPGLNLHRYLKSKIGIIGKRGYHQRLQLNHVIAERIIVLEEKK